MKNSIPSAINTESNFRKFQSANPLVKFLVNNFYSNIRNILSGMEYRSFLDAGCGEGITIQRLADLLPPQVTAFDINPVCIEYAAPRSPSVNFCVADITQTPFKDKSFDLTISLEVLEHLPQPEKGLQELLRITREHIVLSVPDEPYFTLGSLMRGKYLKNFGRHPEHINSWNSRTFGKFIAEHNVNYKSFRSFPWLIAVIDI
ncbi:MAG: class I SAM-dependent methyltransferase [Victivallaceae bacterium]|nr:class I SAM-dependent methyltransferase [Victivallaceae bacterium]